MFNLQSKNGSSRWLGFAMLPALAQYQLLRIEVT
jgi:hypothetical protein